MCHIGDYEPCDVFTSEWRKARASYRGKPVQHICQVCRHPIAAGDCYLRHFSLFEGYKTTEKVCAVCGTLWQSFVNAHEGGLTPGSLIEMLHDCISETSSTHPWGAEYWDTVKESREIRAEMRKIDGQWRTYLAIVKRRQSRAPKPLKAVP